MKQKNNQLLLIISGITLFFLLVIQVYWLVKAAQIKESLFNEKANLVLSRTTEVLAEDQQMCGSIGQCVDRENTTELTSKLENRDVRKIDSILNHFMDLYHIRLKYSFKIVSKAGLPNFANTNYAGTVYSMPIEAMAIKKGIDIKLAFPNKREFILAEMGLPFVSSIILIIVIIIIFWRTNLALIRERKIAFNTKELVNNLAHEFKTPLTNIALAAKMIKKDNSLNEVSKVKNYATLVLEENKKLDTKIESLLHLNALEKNEISLDLKNENFHEIISIAVGNMQIQLDHHNTKLNFNLNAQNCFVFIDKEQMVQVISNLIDNAIKYTESKSEITLSTKNNNQYFTFEIADNGIGLNKEYQNKVFEKYYRVPNNNVHNVKGFGLGLTYVKKIVEMHHGNISLYSEPANGTTFKLNLPYAK